MSFFFSIFISQFPHDFFTHGVSEHSLDTRTSAINFRDGSNWVALSTDDGLAVALYAPGDHLWSIGLGGGGDKPTSFLQAWQWLELAPEQTGTATAWIVVGTSLDQLRQRIGVL